MRFGVGGGAFGVRGGISNRGIGVGVGPFSAGTGWGGRRSRGGGGGGGGLLAFLMAAAFLFFIAAWPYMLGTYVAVQCGAWNPSTARFVVGWCFEVVYIAALLGGVLAVRARTVKRATAEARQVAGTEITDTPTGNGAIKHELIWPAAILAVGLITGLIILAVNPIHSPAADAVAKPCPSTIAVDAGTAATIKMPDLVGQNAGGVENQLKLLGVTKVELSSANPEYHSVWVASNWTVVSTDPAPGCMIDHYQDVTVYVTK